MDIKKEVLEEEKIENTINSLPYKILMQIVKDIISISLMFIVTNLQTIYIIPINLYANIFKLFRFKEDMSFIKKLLLGDLLILTLLFSFCFCYMCYQKIKNKIPFYITFRI